MLGTQIKKSLNKGVAKVPSILQMEALECGAASLAMVLAYYGKWIPLEQVRADCGVSRDGSNARNVLVAARAYGLKAKGYRYEPDALRQKGAFPCILHWNLSHFVVLNGFKGNRAVINDPAKGTAYVTMDEFDKAFSGICLMLEPSESFEPSGKRKSVLKFVKKRLKGTGAMLLFVALTTMVTSLLGIINPAFSRVFLDVLLPEENTAWLVPFLWLMAGVTGLAVAAECIKAVYMLKIEGKLAIVSSSSFFFHILRLPLKFYSQRMAGDIAMRQAANEDIAGTLVKQIAPLLLDVVMLVLYLTVMIRYSLLLSAVGVASILLNMLLAHIISKKRIQIAGLRFRNQALMHGTAISGIEMVETIKASGAEDGFFVKWAGYQAAVNASDVEFAKVNQYLGMLPSLVQSIANIAILVMGAGLVTNGAFTPGMLLAFQGFMAQFSAPAMSLIAAGQSVTETRTEMERVEDVMNYQPDVEDGNLPDASEIGFDKLGGLIELKNVTFGYSALAEPLLKNFSLTVKPGQRIALVGPSGCGKSTLSKLISGMYEPWEGEILYDGKPKSAYNRRVFTSSLAVVDQDIILFNDTISANIKMWDNSIEDYEIILAARDAQLHQDIMRRDGGYAYKMADGGRDFSGGQRQRMEIARALSIDPTVIILDEATSALDAKTEYETVEHIKRRGATCIVIAHRLSTVRDCDEILVMERGEIVERGTHEELYALGSKYAELVSVD